MSGQSGLKLTQRALNDIRGIREYSKQHWGEAVAERCIDEIEGALDRLLANPRLATHVAELHKDFRFYRVNKHLLACSVIEQSVVVLTVMHASMDIPARLAELQPTMAAEIEMLHRQLSQSRDD